MNSIKRRRRQAARILMVRSEFRGRRQFDYRIRDNLATRLLVDKPADTVYLKIILFYDYFVGV